MNSNYTHLKMLSIFAIVWLFNNFNSNATMTHKSYQATTISEHQSYLQYIKTAGGKMAYLDVGEANGKVLLLVHGVPTNSWLYRHIITDLLARGGYRIIVPDLLGFGASDKPKNVDWYNLKKQGKRLLSLMDTLNIDKWVHVCHDAGGLWSWEMLAQTGSERITQLVLLNTIVFKEGFKPPMTFKRGTFKAKAYTWTYKSMAKTMIMGTLKNGLCYKEKATKEMCKGYWKPMKSGGNRPLYNFFTSFEEIDKKLSGYQQSLGKLSAPTLIVWGKLDDILVGEAQIPLIKQHLNVQDNDIHLIEDGKHFIQEEHPKKIAMLIHNFVQQQ